jgi:hypothetical protein
MKQLAEIAQDIRDSEDVLLQYQEEIKAKESLK